MILADVLAELRALNRPVPRPMRLPTPEEVDAAERQLGVEFHPAYRTFLLEASDVVYGTLEPCTVTRSRGHTDLIEIAESAWEAWEVPMSLLPICYDNGDHYCLNQAGEVVFWSHDGVSDEKWPDLATWIKVVWIEGG